MPSHRILRLICALCFLCLAALPASAQDDPAFTTAAQPYSSYHGGAIDHVDLMSGNLSIDIPLMSYPQKGSKLSLSFGLHYQSGPAIDNHYCDDSGDCWDQWTPLNRGWVAGPEGQPMVSSSPVFQSDGVAPYCYIDQDQYGNPFPSYCFNEDWIQTLDQAVHQLLPISTSNSSSSTCRAVDGSGYVATTNSILDSAGVAYSGSAHLTLPLGISADVWQAFPTQIVDTDGNRITANIDSNDYITSWTDTVANRPSIPAPVQDTPSASDPYPCPTSATDPTHLSGQPGVAYSFLWNFPSPNGGTSPVKICITNLATAPRTYDLQLQSIVLYNGKAWTFEYDVPEPSYSGDLLQVNFPTGGSLSYTWSAFGPRICNAWACMGDIVASRTSSPQDGTAAGTSHYTYAWQGSGFSKQSVTTVTDAAGNDAVHTFTNLDTNFDNAYYETNVGYYQGTGGSRTPLKAVTTGYHYIMPFDAFCNISGKPWVTCVSQLYGYAANVFPTSVTTQMSDTGQMSWVTYAYDNNTVTFYQPVYNITSGGTYWGSTSWGGSLGRPTSVVQVNYDSTVLSTGSTTYQFQANSSYLTANLLDLPSSVSLTNAGFGSSVTFNYDENNGSPQCVCGNLTSTHRWLNTTSSYITATSVYDSAGRPIQSLDAKSNSTSFGYSPNTSIAACVSAGTTAYAGSGPTSVTNALGQTTYSCYDLDTGLQTLVQDPNGQQTVTSYDSMLRTSSVTYPDTGQTNYCYGDEPAGGCPQSAPPYKVVVSDKITSSITKTETAVIDGLGRLKQKQLNSDPSGTTYIDYTYDPMGRQYSVSNPYHTTSDATYGVSETLYDALGRTCLAVPQDATPPAPPAPYTCPTSQPTNTIFTAYSGNTTTVTDEAGKKRKSATDAAGRLTDVWEDPNGLNYHTSYTYDVLGDLLTVSQGGSHNRTFIYDSLKRLLQSTNPEAGTVCYGTLSGSTCQNNGYDADGNLIYKSDARGLTITYGYDPLNRMTGRSYSNGDPSVSYTYGTTAGSSCPGGAPSFNIGRRIAMTDAGGSETFAYDPMGRECTEQRTTNSITKTTSYTYNLDGSLATLTYPSGRMITYTPDAAGRPLSAVDTANGINYASSASYAPTGGLAQIQNGTNLVTTLLYNPRLQPCWLYATTGTALPTSTSCTGTATAGNILDLKYNFNLGASDNGNVVGIANNRDTTRSQAFTYDALNRITAAGTSSTTGSNCWGEQYTVDQWANITAIAAQSGYSACSQESGMTITMSPSANNQVSASSGFAYDGAGNVTSDGVNSYAWNAESEMKTGGGVNYTYDGDGNRLQKSNGKIYWYGAGTEILDESDASGNISHEYVFFGGKRIAMDTVSGTGGGSISGTYYYAEDFLGSSRTMVQAGQTSPCYDADFYPFGGERDVVSTCTPVYKFEGKERDTETQNDDFGARYYSWRFGRWESPDWSSIPAPVPYANLTNPQTLNLYAMVQDNPESFADLDGHWNSLATSKGLCDVTTGNGCDNNEQSILARLPAYVGHNPKNIADFVNFKGYAGEPFAYVPSAVNPAEKLERKFDMNYRLSIYFSNHPKVQKATADTLLIGIQVGAALLTDGGSEVPEAAAATSEMAEEAGTSVIGHYPEYTNLAQELKANYFSIPKEQWSAMTETERWAANQKFLDDAIARGDTFRLATRLKDVREGSSLEKEIQYLLKSGYKLQGNGTALVPPIGN
jgi:RHS repeat-associated protein